MALWAIRESQKKLDRVEAKGRIREIDGILADPDFKPTPDQRERLEQRKSDLEATTSR